MAKKAKKAKKAVKRRKRIGWTAADVKELRVFSRTKTAVKKIAKAMKRTEGALRQKARGLGIPLGHRR